MTVATTTWILVQVLIGYHLVFPVLLLLIYSVVSLSKSRKQDTPKTTESDYAIIVTAYEQTDLVPSVVRSILELNYSNYIVYVVADNCDISGLHFDSDKVVLLRPETTIASNTGSHFYAIRNFVRKHERLTIIDSDNLVHPEYLNELNKYFDQGYEAVQGVREAKNLDTMYACLDAARDKYYHFYDGKILFGAGASATLAGSGMAFTTQLYRDCLEHREIKGAGFDKILQYEIVKRKMRIAFAERAVVFDEKTSASDQLVKQRARWINTWFKYFGFGFKLIGSGVLRMNWNQLLFGVLLLRPPLFLFVLLSLFFLAVNVVFDPVVAVLWFSAFGLFVAGFLLSLLMSGTSKAIWRSLVGIPRFIFLQLVSLGKARKANQISIATKHTIR